MQSPLSKHLEGRRLILASGSPRRRELLGELGLEFTLGQIKDYDETYPASLKYDEIPAYIAEQKSVHYKGELEPGDILITSDTIVAIDGDILGKPKDKAEAIKMLRELSGRTHHVVTGLCIRSTRKTVTISDTCEVTFDILSDEDIEYYVDYFKPFDKAGAYGIQEWIGLSNIKSITGSVYTVIGLPVQKLYKALLTF
ncbi:MAG: septum formation protein Maf [Bacteroidales bacterium]|jgi:septum formation protein|nr:septum formation protein Maf [Bacteroidales bacterium]